MACSQRDIEILSSTTIFSSFDMKVCPYKDLNQTSLQKNFQNFLTKSLRDMKIPKNACCIHCTWKRAYILESPYLEKTSSKSSESFFQASLAEVFIWAKFHVKTRKYGCAGKVGSYRENSLKSRYLARNKLWAQTLFTVNIVH